MGDIAEQIAIELWHRFSDTSVEEWEDETHKEEYRLAAADLLAIAHRDTLKPPERRPILLGSCAQKRSCQHIALCMCEVDPTTLTEPVPLTSKTWA